MSEGLEILLVLTKFSLLDINRACNKYVGMIFPDSSITCAIFLCRDLLQVRREALTKCLQMVRLSLSILYVKCINLGIMS